MKDINELFGMFSSNGIYQLNNTTECINYRTQKIRSDFYLTSLFDSFNFDLGIPSISAPKMTIHARIILLLIVKYGVINLDDLRGAYSLRLLQEENTPQLTNIMDGALKKMIDKDLVDNGLVSRAKIKQTLIENQKENIKYFYVFAPTKNGIALINKTLDKDFNEGTIENYIDDINIRDKIGRMAITHVALKFERNGYYYDENHYSNTGNRYEWFPAKMYNEEKNCEIVIMPAYFVRNPLIETEIEFAHKKETRTKKMLKWLCTTSHIQKNKIPAKRRLIIVCNGLMEFNEFLKILFEKMNEERFISRINDIYATSIGMVNQSNELSQILFHHRETIEQNGKIVPCKEEINYIE